MPKVAIVTDSNSGITQAQGKMLGIFVIPMPFYINGELYYEDINLTTEAFYQKLGENASITTSMPALGELLDLWTKLLQSYDQVLYIPMSSGLSSSCASALALAEENYENRVFVVNNQRISVTLRQSVLDAIRMVEEGMDAPSILKRLEETRFDSSIYITLDTLYYLKKGGRITPAAAAIGTLLHLKPVLQIQGEKLDAYSKCRTLKQAKATMIAAVAKDIRERFQLEDPSQAIIAGAYTCPQEEADQWKAEVQAAFPNNEIYMAPLSLSVSCHIGPGAIAVTASKDIFR